LAFIAAVAAAAFALSVSAAAAAEAEEVEVTLVLSAVVDILIVWVRSRVASCAGGLIVWLPGPLACQFFGGYIDGALSVWALVRCSILLTDTNT
jgi:hypothetical protein